MNKKNLESFKEGLKFFIEWSFSFVHYLDEKETRDVIQNSQELKNTYLPSEFWISWFEIENYIDRKVGKEIFDINFGDYWWLFDKEWAFRDGTIEGLVKRIDILLTEGLPINWLNQLAGRSPLEYAENDLSLQTKIIENIYTVFWLDGRKEVIAGTSIENAFTKAGYGTEAAKNLDFFKHGNKLRSEKHVYCSIAKKWQDNV